MPIRLRNAEKYLAQAKILFIRNRRNIGRFSIFQPQVAKISEILLHQTPGAIISPLPFVPRDERVNCRPIIMSLLAAESDGRQHEDASPVKLEF